MWKDNIILHKQVSSSFICDTDDITFVDRYLTEDLDIDETRCVITVRDKGEIEIAHSYDEIKELKLNNRKQISGYGN